MASLQKHLRADFSQERETSNYKARYQFLKDKLKFLLYENECFQEALRSTQRQLLKANRDKSFLLDRLLYYERVDASLSDSDEETDSSGDDVAKVNNVNSVKVEDSVINQQSHVYSSSTINSEIPAKKKKPNVKPVKSVDYQTDSSSISVVDKREQVPEHMYNLTDSEDESIQYYVNDIMNCPQITDGHMTPEEVERHLESRQNYLELVPEKAPPTVPTEMFSNDTSLDKLE